MQRSLSPRVTRVIKGALNAEQAEAWERKLPTFADSVLAINILYANGAHLAADMDVDEETAAVVWEAADQEADAIEAAKAKVRLIAKRYAEPSPPRASLCKPGARRRLSTMGTKRARTATTRPDDAKGEADAKLENALEEAFTLAMEAESASGRMREMTRMQMTTEDQRGLLRNLFLHKVSVSSTLDTHLRNASRLRRWSAGKGMDPWRLTPLQAACFIRDESRSGPTVGMGLRNSLVWLNFVLDLGWNMDDPLIVSVAGKDRRAARAGREQAKPYTHDVVNKLLEFHAKAEGAYKLAAGFALTQAMGVLRFSDLDRSKGLTVNADTLYGTTWKSKSKQEGMPWAMPRFAWSGYDVGGKHMQHVEAMIGNSPDRNWQWPAMQITGGQLELILPPRHGSYGNCLMAHNFTLRKAGVEGDYTLHSPRFYLPGLAGQVGMSMEQRRTLGHWGPNSNMPVRYDQARCCTELRMKADIWQRLALGWEPAKDFHIPTPPEIQKTTADMKVQRQERMQSKDTTAQGDKDEVHIIINHKSMMVHRADPLDSEKSACQYARVMRAHYDSTTEAKGNLTLYTRCMAPACFGKPCAELPKWSSDEASDDGSSTGTHARVSSSDGSSGTNSS